MDIYFISGLGADKRIFQKLILPENFTVHYIEWLHVYGKESLQNYCRRLSEQIDQSRQFILIGVSFGGIVAVQLSRLLKPVQTIIISSFCFKKEVSKFYIFLGKTSLFKLLPSRFLLKSNNFLFRLFGAVNAEEKKLLTDILSDTDPEFFNWALNKLFAWDNSWRPKSFLHIHGTADRILPYRANMNAIPVEGGQHLMVFSRADEISRLLAKNLLNL